ncbi:sigma-54 dependent transcriptional regulator [Dyadobacter sp. CY261]|uniref:sigma-54 interaction domain-containing protein n=1 Tax=Dyadobacter sp. CY261 TaxID=2907203 RepID=UPI001F15A125|nr:sigma-54 dependent transcriptional regulator [Dyadobacter sp. CY261]MCF0068833.1 sigma-54 dependent transcriptional regulator [Dyadobacter sp. CY261]
MEIPENFPEIIGSSAPIEHMRQLMAQVAGTHSTVLLLGETGTGKELVAKAIHRNSPRNSQPLVIVNCAALPVDLIESELFGHEKGSFTGASETRIGKWELADNGTLFLDEIGEMPLEVQAKLLRTLQEREIERIGGKTVIKTNVRVIAATNKDLSDHVRQGNFRSDLFFRLNVFPIIVPPLRERKQDIGTLTKYFLQKHAQRIGRKVPRISGRVIRKLLVHSWPGNVRELENLIEQSMLMSSGPVIEQLFLSPDDEHLSSVMLGGRIKSIDEVLREHILQVLRLCEGKVAGPGGAAEALRVPPTTLHSMIKRLGIRKSYPTGNQ